MTIEKIKSSCFKLFMAGLFFYMLISFYYQHDMGLSDQGDFSRSSSFITNVPIQIKTYDNNEILNSWGRYTYISFWKIDWNWKSLGFVPSSTILLWLPGITLNYLLFSHEILWLPSLSLFPKLFSVLFLWLLIKWASEYSRYFLGIMLISGPPIVLIFTNTAYIAYWNSFFLETGGFIYLFAFIATFIFFVQNPSINRFMFALVTLFLLATSKPAYLYWLLFGVPYLLFVWHRTVRKHPYRFALIGLVLTSALIFIAQKNFIIPIYSQYNVYNSIFLGALKFSDDPLFHLNKNKIPEAISCVNLSPFFAPEGVGCFERFNSLSFFTTFQIIANEPVIIMRKARFAASQMQDITIDYLSRYSINNPRFPQHKRIPAANERTFAPYEKDFFNLWAYLKYYYFPIGSRIYFFLLGFCIFCVLIYFKSSHLLRKTIASVGLLTSLLCIVDIVLTILFGGVIELIKHLFMANLLFDISLIALLLLTTTFFVDWADLPRNLYTSKIRVEHLKKEQLSHEPTQT